MSRRSTRKGEKEAPTTGDDTVHETHSLVPLTDSDHGHLNAAQSKIVLWRMTVVQQKKVGVVVLGTGMTQPYAGPIGSAIPTRKAPLIRHLGLQTIGISDSFG